MTTAHMYFESQLDRPRKGPVSLRHWLLARFIEFRSVHLNAATGEMVPTLPLDSF